MMFLTYTEGALEKSKKKARSALKLHGCPDKVGTSAAPSVNPFAQGKGKNK